MKQFIYITFLQLFSGAIVFGQPIINERYIINETTTSVFSTVISTDTCYYVSCLQTSVGGFENFKSSLIRFNFDGTIADFSEISNDTLGISFFNTSQMIKTLDGNFVHLAVAKENDFPITYLFVKMKPSGDTLITKYYRNFYNEDGNEGKDPSTLIQKSDSTYFGLIHMQNDTDFLAGVTFFRLDKNGELLYKKNFYGVSLASYNALASASMVQYSDTTLVIGCAYRKDYGDTDEKRHHTKLMVIDTLGNLIEEHTYWEDTLALDCYGLTKTADGGLIYCGRIGRHNPVTNGFRYRGQIVKLNTDFSVDWKMIVGDWTGSPYIGLRNILALNDSEFVMVGFMRANQDNNYNQYGWLIKFNIDGKKIWERKYLKITHEHLAPNYPEHELYDLDTTSDGGFVMVGQAINHYDDNGYLPGQKAWLLKTNRYGCIVPGCQLGDSSVEPEPQDTVIDPHPKAEEPITWLYPNPASNSLFYYHHQDNFNFGTASIYNAAGEIVQKWDITTNDITYEIDVSQLAAGMYILSVLDADGREIEVERFVKV